MMLLHSLMNSSRYVLMGTQGDAEVCSDQYLWTIIYSHLSLWACFCLYFSTEAVSLARVRCNYILLYRSV